MTLLQGLLSGVSSLLALGDGNPRLDYVEAEVAPRQPRQAAPSSDRALRAAARRNPRVVKTEATVATERPLSTWYQIQKSSYETQLRERDAETAEPTGPDAQILATQLVTAIGQAGPEAQTLLSQFAAAMAKQPQPQPQDYVVVMGIRILKKQHTELKKMAEDIGLDVPSFVARLVTDAIKGK
jgi:hypothetical protein